MSVKVRIMGDDVAARDPHEVMAELQDVPRAGDLLSVWTGDEEVYLTVEKVIWPTWEYLHDPGREPTVCLRRERGYDDEEWSDFFAAIKEKRQP
jgi:hypothetical protein